MEFQIPWILKNFQGKHVMVPPSWAQDSPLPFEYLYACPSPHFLVVFLLMCSFVNIGISCTICTNQDFQEELEDISYPQANSLDAYMYQRRNESVPQDHAKETKFPASISIGSEWHQMPKLELAVQTTKFALKAINEQGTKRYGLSKHTTTEPTLQ